ncbi:hypothetical protein B0181_03755 [Moraxella caviae]|uniref:DNA-directed DNA polymerase n=1 Tax=Moraxella caviae TaxID=34060 RepID=A0A1T0A685_9GAMM|nr:hypothetical protein B0181_03755 [Moraxella caviae]
MKAQTVFDDSAFATKYAWQDDAWAQLITQYQQGRLPHAMLAAGMAGIGKRAFVWRFVAWLLCENKFAGTADNSSDDSLDTQSNLPAQFACGHCESCTWLKAGTHPDVLVLPKSDDDSAQKFERSIKIDDIRNVQEYSHSKGKGERVIVLDYADTLTIAAANALLKTLEEPRSGVHLLLITDHVSRLLPTIKSRVQALPLEQIDERYSLEFLKNILVNDSLNNANDWQVRAKMLLALADGAPLVAADLPQQAWFAHRGTWLKTLAALRTGRRSVMAASDYWQGELTLAQFCMLSRVMLLDLWRMGLGLPSLHTDLSVADTLASVPSLATADFDAMLNQLNDTAIATTQNVQEKFAYDALMSVLAGQAG